MATEIKKTEQEWREELTPEQYHVLREAGTERAFSGQYWDCHDDGVYRCAACGAELFDAGTKFESGSGWPSFTEPKLAAAVELREDNAYGMRRTEVVCKTLRRPPRPRVRRRPARQGRAALLHQLRFAGPRAGADAYPPTVGDMAVVSARGLVRTFGTGRAARRVLDGTDVDVAAGEIVAVLGRSGSGKSTLLHVLGGLDRPEAGTVEVAGERVTGAGERRLSALRRRHIGFVFQFFHLLPELTGEANVLLAGRVRGARPDAAARARALIDRLGLRRRRGLAPAPALRRRAAALRDRPRARQRPGRAAGRRADGQPRHRGGRRGPGAAARARRRGPRGRCSSRTRRARRRSPTACCGSRPARLVPA